MRVDGPTTRTPAALALTLAAVLSAGAVSAATPAAAAGSPCGAVLLPGSAWLFGSGVDVRSNGSAHGTSTACAGWSTTQPTVQNGYGWQGVELAARLYASKGWGLVQANGGPGTQPYRHAPRYLPEGSRGLRFHANGTGYLPVPGDLVVETNSTSGRVAVVDRVAGATVHVVEQNAAVTGRYSYALTGTTLRGARGAGASVRGVLHSPRNGTAAATTRVSVAADGAQARDVSYSPTVSADGRYVAFLSEAGNLVPGDTNTVADAFVRDLRTGAVSRVSVGTGGTQADLPSGFPTISADGRHVAFTSFATNLVPGDTNDRMDVFVHDRLTRRTSRANVSTAGAQVSDGYAHAPSLSADGRYVAFTSPSTNLGPRPADGEYPRAQVFVRDQVAGTTTLVSYAADGTRGNGDSYDPKISANGRYVAFSSRATNFGRGYLASYRAHVFVRDRRAGTTTLVSVGSPGGKGNADSHLPVISATGRYVTFISAASNLVAGDTNAAEDAFVRDRWTGSTTRIGVVTPGVQATSASTGAGISADGRYVTFTSDAPGLVPGDTNGTDDVFLRDRETGTTTLVSVGTDGARGDLASTDAAISADGHTVVFTSAAATLVPDDTNTHPDVFLRSLR